MQLRPYQHDVTAGITAGFREQHRGILVVIPTGGGKTVVFCNLADVLERARRATTLILVPADELLEQTRDKLRAFKVRHGVVAASYDRNPDPGALVQVAMVWTLRSRGTTALLRTPDLIIIDEAHMAAAESFTTILQWFQQARVLGFTATPWRLDRQGFRFFASKIVVGPTVPELQRVGALVPFVTRSVKMTEFAAQNSNGKRDFNKRKIAAAYNRSALVGATVDKWLEYGGGQRLTLVFASSLDHSRNLRDQFSDRGFIAEHLDGETQLECPKCASWRLPQPAPDCPCRRAILARHSTGRTQIVCNFGVLCAGYDCPPVSCIVVARATLSKSLWIQMAGRGLRPSPETGKIDCLVVDCGGNARRHGNLSYPHTYTLDGKQRADGVDDLVDLGKECPRCEVVNDCDAPRCVSCDLDFASESVVMYRKPRASMPQLRDGDLEVIASDEAPVDLTAPAPPRSSAETSEARGKGWKQHKINQARDWAADFNAA